MVGYYISDEMWIVMLDFLEVVKIGNIVFEFVYGMNFFDYMFKV